MSKKKESPTQEPEHEEAKPALQFTRYSIPSKVKCGDCGNTLATTIDVCPECRKRAQLYIQDQWVLIAHAGNAEVCLEVNERRCMYPSERGGRESNVHYNLRLTPAEARELGTRLIGAAQAAEQEQ